MSLMAPEAERFFIASIRDYLGEIQDPELQAQCRTFIREEGAHSREHHRLNEQLHAGELTSVRLLMPVRSLLHWARRIGSRRFNLALTAAGEHLSAIMSELFLAGGRAADIDDPEIRDLYEWHAREEMGHRDVAYDVLASSAMVGYPLRILALLMVSLAAPLMLMPVFLRLLWVDADSRRPRVWIGGLAWLVGWRQSGPGPRHLMRNYLRYFRPDFHPAQIPAPV